MKKVKVVKKADIPVVEPEIEDEPEVLEHWTPSIGEKVLFSTKLGDFVGTIESFDPPRVIRHEVVNGCVTDTVLDYDDLKGCSSSQLTKAEAFQRIHS